MALAPRSSWKRAGQQLIQVVGMLIKHEFDEPCFFRMIHENRIEALILARPPTLITTLYK